MAEKNYGELAVEYARKCRGKIYVDWRISQYGILLE